MGESRESGVALLVGAGDAIGAAAARRFAAGGYSVCVARRDAEKSRSVVQEIIAAGGTARAGGTDGRSEEAVHALFAQIHAEVGPGAGWLLHPRRNHHAPLLDARSQPFTVARHIPRY